MEKKLSLLINKLAVCQATCNYCLNACLNEDHVKMLTDCIKRDKECAEICGLAISLLSSYSIFDRKILQLCINACEKCADECLKHEHIHCRECAKACKDCAEVCKTYI